jgi:hypothetical protein
MTHESPNAQEMYIIGKWRGNQVSMATNTHTTVKEKLDAVFSMQSMLRQHNEDQWDKRVSNDFVLIVGG